MYRYRRRFVTSMILLLILAYLGALAVSTAHLSQLYALFNAGLPYWVSIGLAVALEAVAFLFSIISTSLGKRAGPWAAPASTSALLLVWAGNGYAMMRAAPNVEWYVVLAASCFVPVCTLFVGKVLGGQFSLLDELGQEEREDQAQRQQPHGQRLVEPSAAPTMPAAVTHPRTAPVAVTPPIETFQIAPEAEGRADVEPSAEASTILRDITAVHAARQEPVEVRPSPNHHSGDPTSAIGPVRTAGETASQIACLPDASPADVVPAPDAMNFPDHSPTASRDFRGPESDYVALPETSPAEAGPFPDGVNLPGHSPTVSGGDGLPMDASPTSSGELQETQGAVGEAEAQKTPEQVTGLHDRTDEALGRVRLSREDLKEQAGMLKVHDKAKVKAEQRVLALKYSQAGVAVTRLAAELGCDESTLRSALKQTKAALQPAEDGK